MDELTKLQQAKKAAQRAEQAAKEAAELVSQLEKESKSGAWTHTPGELFWVISCWDGSLHSMFEEIKQCFNCFPNEDN